MEKKGAERRKVPLTAMGGGQSGTVASIDQWDGRGAGRCMGFEKRLMDMGLTSGTKVTVVKSAPFHGPVEILVRGSRLALGRGIAERVYVEIEGE
jgi:DtxR family Mn-dependent transcriptional regulator